jgi:ABC-type amino acid transport substrate-binding protein
MLRIPCFSSLKAVFSQFYPLNSRDILVVELLGKRLLGWLAVDLELGSQPELIPSLAKRSFRGAI